jgi:predicted transport protein
MPTFEINSKRLVSIEQTNFSTEKELQSLIESNLGVVFNCRLVATEFSTGAQHAGRIDTLALSEDDNPVIIEYKKVESSDLINQSLFYLSWIYDHRGDFQVAAQKALGSNIKVDWSDVRVICIAPNYKKYDLHAVKMTGANIELWQYRLFKNSILYLEEVFQRAVSVIPETTIGGKSAVMIAAGKKAAITRATGTYTFEEHLQGKSDEVRELCFAVKDFIMDLDPAMEEVPKKFYIAYKISQNIACMKVESQGLLLFLKLDPKQIDKMPKIARDVSKIGHVGTGNFEIRIRSEQDIEITKPYLEMAYRKVGG